MKCRCRQKVLSHVIASVAKQSILIDCLVTLQWLFLCLFLIFYSFPSPQLYKIFLLYNSLDFFPLLCYNVIERR